MRSGLKLISGIIVGFILVWTITSLTADNDLGEEPPGKGNPGSFNSTGTEPGSSDIWDDEDGDSEDDNGNGTGYPLGNQTSSRPNSTQSEDDNMTVEGYYASSPRRQYFWKPFATRWRAEGFAETLCRNHNIECGVAKLKNGSFRIYFEYADQADLESKLSLLRESSGFDSLQTDN